MKNEKILNYVAILLIVIFMVAPLTIVFAATSSELKQQQSDIQNKISETNSEIKDVKKQKSATLSQIENMISEASNYKDEIS